MLLETFIELYLVFLKKVQHILKPIKILGVIPWGKKFIGDYSFSKSPKFKKKIFLNP